MIKLLLPVNLRPLPQNCFMVEKNFDCLCETISVLLKKHKIKEEQINDFCWQILSYAWLKAND